MKTLISIIILLLFSSLTILTAQSQEIKSAGKKIKINNLPEISIVSINLADANHNNLIEAEENCFLEIILKNTGNGVAKTVNLDVSLDGVPVKGFNFKKSIYAGNLIEGKEYTYQAELYPMVNMGNGSARLKVEALEGNAYNSKPKYITLNLKANLQRLAVGWINPLSETTTVYEADFSIKNCIVSATSINQMKVYLNGEVVSDKRGMKLVKSEDCDYEAETEVKLRAGINRIYVEVTNNTETIKSETKSIIFTESLLENRLALIIGNANYTRFPLRNSTNDAKAMAKTLRELNFDVIEIIDGTKEQMKNAVVDFIHKLDQKKGVGLFYYAGHGVQIKGENYLVPVDNNLQSEKDVEFDAIPVNNILDNMQTSGTRMNIVILDACRDNPFPATERGLGRGLAQVYAEGSGSLIAYSTAPGSVAADGEGENGLYTQELLKAIKAPGMEIGLIFRKVLTNVKKLSDGRQIPWTNASIEGEFYFKK
jgi:hypothetical protein